MKLSTVEACNSFRSTAIVQPHLATLCSKELPLPASAAASNFHVPPPIVRLVTSVRTHTKGASDSHSHVFALHVRAFTCHSHFTLISRRGRIHKTPDL